MIEEQIAITIDTSGATQATRSIKRSIEEVRGSSQALLTELQKSQAILQSINQSALGLSSRMAKLKEGNLDSGATKLESAERILDRRQSNALFR